MRHTIFQKNQILRGRFLRTENNVRLILILRRKLKKKTKKKTKLYLLAISAAMVSWENFKNFHSSV
jgi:hypothetical protein